MSEIEKLLELLRRALRALDEDEFPTLRQDIREALDATDT